MTDGFQHLHNKPHSVLALAMPIIGSRLNLWLTFWGQWRNLSIIGMCGWAEKIVSANMSCLGLDKGGAGGCSVAISLTREFHTLGLSPLSLERTISPAIRHGQNGTILRQRRLTRVHKIAGQSTLSTERSPRRRAFCSVILYMEIGRHSVVAR